VYKGDGPKVGATEPYFVTPESASSYGQPKPETKSPTTIREAVTQMFEPETPAEPYTTYEGRRYLAEMRLDHSHWWAQIEYLHWWSRRVNTPALVTTGGTGVLGANGTNILIGEDTLGPWEFSGIRGTVGWWRDPERLTAIELTGIWLGQKSREYSAVSDATGNPLLAQPFLDPNEAAYIIAAPGEVAGRVDVSDIVNFHSIELNLVRNLIRYECWSLDTVLGLRYMYLNDTLTMNQNFTVLPGGAGNFPFNGVGQPAGANFLINDTFNITNRFYGGQIGLRANRAWCRWDIGATLKLGFGAVQHAANIDGSSTLNVNGTTTTVTGGTFASPSNIGRHTSTDFGVVPEINLTLGYQITQNLRMMVGYNFLYWSRIQRPGILIDRQIDGTQVPTSPLFGTGTDAIRPAYFGQRTDIWLQGVNLGLELRF
jgi:hypothetical protein